MKRLDLVVGPNGAGKSTFIALTLGPLLPGSVVVNADDIAKQRWPQDPAAHSYDAAKVAAATRSALIARGRSFIAETVFSHPSKLDLLTEAQSAGYIVVVHVVLVPEDLAVQRVAHRVQAGGHHVPEDKIRQRHRRLVGLVTAAAIRADTATVYDNSRLAGPRVIAQLAGGDLIGAPRWPSWTPQALAARWP
ncbi:ATPase [Mycolicibacterium anyangense]|uniref:UDP-N-acetylglucosamine kinase n=1 Tax=Mycolicibacterium anyangense TaxID=1431246 RepID=A0A6N4W6K6_9MYCO|nr:zeta toxin family protein [Mycolicibacterium anyangense]BBZ76003.1 ATPase [Mycolicibacterium anyangense]